jgi:NAD(P)-dependent dehydrogenase (short-subunit alcohol dehydrogenase family)
MRLKGKKLVVPGGASGIGEAFVRLAATEGAAEIVIYDVNAEAGERIAAEAGGRCRFTRLDVTDANAIWDTVASEDARGPIDIAVICAGVVSPCGILGRGATDPRKAYFEFVNEFERQTRVNLLGNGNFLAAMMQLYLPRKAGVAVVVTSVAAHSEMAARTPYAATKAGLSMLVRNAANDLYVAGRPDHALGEIVVNGVAPARVETALMINNLRLLREGPGGEEAVEAAKRKFRSSQHSGQVLTPEYVAEWLVRLATDPLTSGTIYQLGGPANFFE